VVESWALIKGLLPDTSPANKLSEQQLADCVYPTLNGCNGGQPTEVLYYIYSNGLMKDDNYGNYTSGTTGTTGPCKSNLVTADATKIKTTSYPGYASIPKNSASGLLSALSTQPVDVSFYVKSSFQSYAGGVYADTNCATKTGTLNHNMAAIGYNVAAGLGNSNSYIIVKNSWGSGWGEQGFARIKATGENTPGICNLYTYNFYPN